MQHTWLRNVGNFFKLNVSLQGCKANISAACCGNVESTEHIVTTDVVSLLFKEWVREDGFKHWCKSWLVESVPAFFADICEETILSCVDNPYVLQIEMMVYLARIFSNIQN